MILPHCFEQAWIEGFRRRKQFRSLNPPVLEKMIQALYLLQNLKLAGMDFVFKGGTSLVLLLDRSSRFSVDIDVITQHSRTEVEAILDQVVRSSHFLHWELDGHRSYKSGIPKAHYQLAYQSSFNQHSNYVLLDLLFEDCHYPRVLELPVKTRWVECGQDVLVRVPSVESILGDKLTAFAPMSTGILYGKGKSLEIIKQLYDLHLLIGEVRELKVVWAAYQSFVTQEIGYRRLALGPEEVLLDTLRACRTLALRERNPIGLARSQFRELQEGIRSFNNFLFGARFHLDQAIEASGKVAYLVSRLLDRDFSAMPTRNELANLPPALTMADWNFLNKLRKRPEKDAFWYWASAVERVAGWQKTNFSVEKVPYIGRCENS